MYYEWGEPDNPRVALCVHGVGRNGRDFDVLGEALAATHRVLAIDMPGRGESDWLADPNDYVFPTYLTALVALLGPARRVTGSARISRSRREIKSQPLAGTMMDVVVPTHVASVIDFHSGPVATLVTSFDVQAARPRNIEIYGSEGTLAVPDPNTFGGPVQIRRRGDKDWSEVPVTHANAAQSRGIGLVEMVRAIRSGATQRASGELACHVLELMEKSVLASERGRHLSLETRCERPAPIPAGLPDDVFERDGGPA